MTNQFSHTLSRLSQWSRFLSIIPLLISLLAQVNNSQLLPHRAFIFLISGLSLSFIFLFVLLTLFLLRLLVNTVLPFGSSYWSPSSPHFFPFQISHFIMWIFFHRLKVYFLIKKPRN